ncbi:IMP cyclohydrolase [Kutzneria sp. NPDC051319]|uniref:IMP cyclohydrolase n=1 Tax=Kutzneria sp. NPDC051319 TaxID=3155047 RepID=UPI0034246FBD
MTLTPYPGRVVALARIRGGALLGGYALTGRSLASRARRLAWSGSTLTVAPLDADPHDPLRHYDAVRADSRWTVLGNGSQVGVVHARLTAGQPPSVALDGLRHEPDPPIFTPRITAVVGGSSAWFGAARVATGVSVVELGSLAVGDVALMTTYESDGETVATTPRHRHLRTSAGDVKDFLAELWSWLDPRFTVTATVFDVADSGNRVQRSA